MVIISACIMLQIKCLQSLQQRRVRIMEKHIPGVRCRITQGLCRYLFKGGLQGRSACILGGKGIGLVLVPARQNGGSQSHYATDGRKQQAKPQKPDMKGGCRGTQCLSYGRVQNKKAQQPEGKAGLHQTNSSSFMNVLHTIMPIFVCQYRYYFLLIQLIQQRID